MPPKSQLKKPAINSNSTTSPAVVVIYWFRTDLRLHDSPALQRALSLNPSRFIPLWTWDPHYVYTTHVGANRWSFLLQSQRDLSGTLTRLNPRQKLHVVRAAPQSVFPELFRRWGVTHLVFEKNTDAYARVRDEAVAKLAGDCGVEVFMESGRTLVDSDELVKRNGGRPTMSMAQVVKAMEKLKIQRPLDPPKILPDPGDLDLTGVDLPANKKDVDMDVNASVRGLGEGKDTQYFNLMGPKNDFGVPTLEELGIDPASATSPHKGGETEALALLKKYIDDEEYVANFEKPKSAPTDFNPQSTTLLSPHLHFGSLSVRKFWWDVQDVFEKRKKAKKHVAAEPMNLPGQLLFRDMYFGAQAALGFKFAQTQGNPVARFVPWHLQSNYSENPVGEHMLDGTYVVDDPQAEEWFQRWKHGRTGFPWIDALMRQLKLEGWIHHLGRHAVACFLTRGGCYVHWERGVEVFEEWLIDHETCCNVGNWMWLSCTAFFSQFFRCYSPIAFPKKWDPEGNFVRKYVPELAKFDKKYIYEPHKAPIADQKAWGCMIQGDGSEKPSGKHKIYPKPMFDFNERRQFCLDKMKEAYDVGMYGNDEKVINGTWKEVFRAGDENHKGAKRARNSQLEKNENGDDDGSHADNGDVSADDAPRPNKSAKTKPSQKSATKGAKKQKTLDTMVSRTKN